MELLLEYYDTDAAELELINSNSCHSMNNKSIKECIESWLKNETECLANYGHISFWDTGKVTDMSCMFDESAFHNLLSPPKRLRQKSRLTGCLF